MSTIKEDLARFMDPGAFREGVPDRVKFTSKEAGRCLHDRLKVRREIAMKRADAAIRFFSKPEERARLDHRIAALAPVDTDRQAETALAGSGRSLGSAVTAQPAGAPPPSGDPS